jgi:hypothetical protein
MTKRPAPKVRFFTCKVGLTGIGDQLSQLGTLYRIGRSFDLTYVLDLGSSLNRPPLIIHPGINVLSAVRNLGKLRSADESRSLVR